MTEIFWRNERRQTRYPWDRLEVGDYFQPNPVTKSTLSKLVQSAQRTRPGKKFGQKTTKHRFFIYRKI